MIIINKKQQEEQKFLQLVEEENLYQDQLKCRKSFWYFCKYVDSVFFTDSKPHLKRIAIALQMLYEGEITKLAISLPPRAGKSWITSHFCAWIFGKDITASIMRNCYSGKLAERFSKDIRDGIIRDSDKYHRIFPDIKLSKNNQAIDSWALEGSTQANYICAGVGGSITGFGCKTIGILDDGLKNIEESMSPITIENLFNWYTSTHLSRLESGCKELHIATRWTTKDPIGRLTDPYSDTYNKDMRVISVPALDENGNSFCDDIMTTAEYHHLRRVNEDFIWQAEYMQRPYEVKGLLFPAKELNRFSLSELNTTLENGTVIRKKPDGVVGFTDTAGRGTDFLCSIIGSKYGSEVYITDCVFTQDGVEITEPLVAQMIISTGCYVHKIEANNGGDQYARNIRRLIQGKSGCMIVDEHQSSNKETRIMMNAGYIKEHFHFRNDIEAGSPYDKYVRALTSYVKMGKNKHDDSPDATTGLCEYVKTFSFPANAVVNADPYTTFNTSKEEEDNTSYFGGVADDSFINYNM